MHARHPQFLALCLSTLACATAPAGPPPPPTLPPNLLPSRQLSPPSPIDQSLREYDRTTNRIVDQPTHELNRIESPPITDLPQIEQDRERQQRIDRQRETEEQQNRTIGPPAASSEPTPTPIPGAVVSLDEDKQGLEAEVLEAVVAYERGTRQAGAELAEDPAALQARRRQLGSQLEHRLDRILAHYDVRRLSLPPPATQPAQ